MSGVVVGVGAVIGAVIGGGMSIDSTHKQNKSMVKNFKKQLYYMQKNYNYNQAQLDRQEKSLYSSAVSGLFQLSFNAHQNNAQVEAALAETGLEGRNTEKIKSTTKATTERQITATKENYLNDVWNIRSQKESLYVQTKDEVQQARRNLRHQLIGGKEAFMNFMNGAAQGAAIGAATAGAGAAAFGASGTVAAGGTGAGAAAGGTSGTVAAGGAGAGALTKTVSTAPSTSWSLSQWGKSAYAGYQTYKPYVDMWSDFANYYNQMAPKTSRRSGGGYYY